MRAQGIMVHACLLPLGLLAGLCSGQVGTGKYNNLHLHKIDLNSIEVKTVKSLVPQAGENITLPASELTGGKNLILQVPPLGILAATADFSTRLTETLKVSVSQALADFGLDSHLAEEGVPLIKTAVEGILRGDPNLVRRELDPRGGGIWGWIKGAGCAVFATASVPAYLLAAADLAIANRHGQRLNEDLMYQVFPIHSDLATSAPVTVYYQATRPPLFGNAAGVTMNRDVYVVNPPPPSFTWQQYPDIYPQFLDLAKLLRHELQHVKQYHESAYNLVTFAHRYLFNFCKAGGYSANPLEVEAKNQEYALNTELYLYSTGLEFFLVWRTFGLIGTLGYPVEDHLHYPAPGGISAGIAEKTFQRGALQLKEQVGASGLRWCFRTFSSEEIYNRDATCTEPTVNLCNKMRKRGQDQRTHDKDGNPIGGEPGGRERCRQRKTCGQLRKEWSGEWARLERRAWRCGEDVPHAIL